MCRCGVVSGATRSIESSSACTARMSPLERRPLSLEPLSRRSGARSLLLGNDAVDDAGFVPLDVSDAFDVDVVIDDVVGSLISDPLSPVSVSGYH